MWRRLTYGTAILAALAGGVALFYDTPRTVIKAVDMAELAEGAKERLMPFSTGLVTNTIRYLQPTWTPDTSSNVWYQGTNPVHYLALSGLVTNYETVVGLNTMFTQGTNTINLMGEEYDGTTWYPSEDPWWEMESLPPRAPTVGLPESWQITTIQTGRTLRVLYYTGTTNEAPAFVYSVTPKAVGAVNYQATLDAIDTAILTNIPNYVDHEQAVDGIFTNQGPFPMLTVSSVWSRLNLPTIWTNRTRTASIAYTNWVDTWTNSAGVTNVTRIGTNTVATWTTNIVTNFAFTISATITTNMLNERYRVLAYLRWTKQDATDYVEYPTWTNSALATGTNLFWNEYPETNYTITAESPWVYNQPPWQPPTYPSEFPDWWDHSASNGPPGGWWAPLETPVFDDTATLGDYSATNGRPYRSADISAISLKWQSYASEAWYMQYGYYRWVFTKAQHLEGHTIINQQRSCPVLRMPANIGQIPVTADIYGKVIISGDRTWTPTPTPYTFRTNLVAGADVTTTTSNAFTWIGSAITPTFDLFTPTNAYFHATWFEWANDKGSIDGIYTGFSSNGMVIANAGYQTSRKAEVRGNGVILKWTFSRCRPAD